MRTSVAPLTPVRFDFAGDAACLACQGILERHQPDEARPERILGVCTECSAWFLIDERLCILYQIPPIWSGSDEEN